MTNILHYMLDMLTGAYAREDVRNAEKGRPMTTNIGRLFSVLSWGLEMVQEQAQRVKEWDDLNNAAGEVLDRYGANVGVARSGVEDPFYRLLIQVKLISQLSGGDIDTVTQAAATLLGVDLTQVELEEVFPAKVWVYVDMEALSEEQLDVIDAIAAMLKRIVAGGVGFRLFLRTDRSYESSIVLSSGACTYSHITIRPPSMDREYTDHIYLSTAASQSVKLTMLPVETDETGGNT